MIEKHIIFPIPYLKHTLCEKPRQYMCHSIEFNGTDKYLHYGFNWYDTLSHRHTITIYWDDLMICLNSNYKIYMLRSILKKKYVNE